MTELMTRYVRYVSRLSLLVVTPVKSELKMLAIQPLISVVTVINVKPVMKRALLAKEQQILTVYRAIRQGINLS